MKTEALIEQLTRQDEQLQIHPPQVGKLLMVGMLVSLLACVLAFGVHPAWTQWLSTSAYWLKFAFGAGSMLLALGLLHASVKPGKPLPYALLWLSLPAVLALTGFVFTPSTAWADQVFAPLWQACAPSILLLAVPIWLALLEYVKGQAPTNLRLAGMLMGAASGGAAAAIYTLHCDEFSSLYIGVWYTAGIALCAALSAAVAPRFLRW